MRKEKPKQKKKRSNTGSYFLFILLPWIFYWGLIIYACSTGFVIEFDRSNSLGGMLNEFFGTIGEWFSIFNPSNFTGDYAFFNILLLIVGCVIASPLILIFGFFAFFIFLFGIPIYLIFFEFIFNLFLLWIADWFLVFLYKGADIAMIGKFAEDTPVEVTGSHYEATVHEDNITVKKVNETSGGSNGFFRFLQHLFRMVLIFIAGPIIFIRCLVIDKKRKQQQ